jgi:RES domain-containing protein
VSTVTRCFGSLAASYCGRGSDLRRVALLCAASCVLMVAVSAGSAAARESFSSSPAGTAATADCSKEAATESVLRLNLNDIAGVADPVGGVLCGSFTGPGSQTMVVSLGGEGSLGMIDWVVFRWSEDAWQFLMKRRQSAELAAVGSDIRERVSIFRAGDPRCCPSGGTKWRIWHWDGTRLVAGPWNQEGFRGFYSPSRNIFCLMSDDQTARRVACTSTKAPQNVVMDANGKLKICRGRQCVPRCGCAEEAPKLAYGRQLIVNRFRCLSQRSGVTCTVIQSGKGFLINSSSVRRVGP